MHVSEPIKTYQTSLPSYSDSSIAWLEQYCKELTSQLPVKVAIELTKNVDDVICISVYTLMIVNNKEKHRKSILVSMNQVAAELSKGVYFRRSSASKEEYLLCLEHIHIGRDAFMYHYEGTLYIYSYNKCRLEELHNEVKNILCYTNKIFLHDIPFPQSQLEAKLRRLSLRNVFVVHGISAIKAINPEYHFPDSKKRSDVGFQLVELYTYEITVYSMEDEVKVMNSITMTLPVLGKCVKFRPYLRSEFILNVPLFTMQLQQWALMTYAKVEREIFDKIIVENLQDAVCVTSLKEPVSGEQVAKLQSLKFGKISHVSAKTLQFIMTQHYFTTVCKEEFIIDVYENLDENTCTAIIISANQFVIDQVVERVESAKRMLATVSVSLLSEHLQNWATDIWEKCLPVSVVDFVTVEDSNEAEVILYMKENVDQQSIQITCNKNPLRENNTI